MERRDRAAYCNRRWVERYPKLATAEFSRDRRRMSVLCGSESDGGGVLFVKGAPESVLENCTHCLTNGDDGGNSLADPCAFPPPRNTSASVIEPMTPAVRQALLRQVAAWGDSSALRTLALAIRSFPINGTAASLSANDERELTFVGLVGLQDPPRPEVLGAVQACHDAGIRVIMVTGDNKATAVAVARQVGLLGPQAKRGDDVTMDGNEVSSSSTVDHDAEAQLTQLTGREFDALQDAELKSAAASSLAVFARVEPSHKTALVEALKAQGQVVAMTGDGVNDAPALRSADIGVAMGSGTAVAKHAADMVWRE